MGVISVMTLLFVSSSTTQGESTAPASDETAIMCNKCETVWVRHAKKINKTTIYRREPKRVCPDCESAVETAFKTDKMEHACKSCGGTLVSCNIHDMPVAQAQAKSEAPAVEEGQAAMCAKCKEIWVIRPHEIDSRATDYQKEKQMACPDCKSAVQSFFTTGKFEHTCKACGDSLSACKLCP
ncbi:MAG TPA: hypothetical protein DCZ95_08345 [Verrucomicrobia bacterium]|nr:MAG: hypothetical protein A2X46_12380 [Lentisphaerae bacterium GWF2_57_35]HBA84088.1 hypothetical protein [Verrucomicrobiota bacterium]